MALLGRNELTNWGLNKMAAILQLTYDIFNSLGPCDTIWRQRSGSPLAHVTACCLTAPSHYLNQCRLFISKVEWHSSKGKFTRDTSAINHWNYLENLVSKISFKFPRGQWVKCIFFIEKQLILIKILLKFLKILTISRYHLGWLVDWDWLRLID